MPVSLRGQRFKEFFTVKPDQVFFKWNENVTFHVEMDSTKFAKISTD